jgi:alpha-D-ribose 1-methylphosphonate 5-triphosphate synthase subunit PhnH
MIESSSPSSAHDQAKIFRMVLEAMSHPGRIVDFKVSTLNPPSGLSTEMATLLFTLCDFQTPIWMKSKNLEIMKFIKFHTGAGLTEDLSAASFVVVDALSELPMFKDLAQGTHEYPDRSSTLLIQVEALSNNGKIVLTGPGIADQTCFGVLDADLKFWEELQANHAQYPLGLDVIFVTRGKIAAIPRSTHIQIKAQD